MIEVLVHEGEGLTEAVLPYKDIALHFTQVYKDHIYYSNSTQTLVVVFIRDHDDLFPADTTIDRNTYTKFTIYNTDDQHAS